MSISGKVMVFGGVAALVLVPQIALAQYEPQTEPVREPEPAPPMDPTMAPPATTQPAEEQGRPIEEEEGKTIIVPQPQPVIVPQPVPQQPVVVTPPPPMPPEEKAGPTGIASINIGGGVANFTQDEIGDLTDVGGYWDARLVLGTRSIVGVEAAYVGSAQNIDALGLDTGATLLRNGAEAALRLNLPFTPQGALIAPYAFGGIGWSRYTLVNEDFNTSNVRDDDDVFAIPFGVGVTGGANRFLIDARFTYRPTFDDDLVQQPNGDTADMQNWSLGASVGYEF